MIRLLTLPGLLVALLFLGCSDSAVETTLTPGDQTRAEQTEDGQTPVLDPSDPDQPALVVTTDPDEQVDQPGDTPEVPNETPTETVQDPLDLPEPTPEQQALLDEALDQLDTPPVLDTEVELMADAPFSEPDASPDLDLEAVLGEFATFLETGSFAASVVTPELEPLTTAQSDVNLVTPFEDTNFVEELGDDEAAGEEADQLQADLLEDVVDADDFLGEDVAASYFLTAEDAEPAFDAEGRRALDPAKKVRERVLYPCTTKPCRVKKVVWVLTRGVAPARSVVVEKHFTYSSVRGARDGDRNLTTAYRPNNADNPGKPFWVFAKVTRLIRFEHGNLKEIIHNEHFEDRKARAYLNVRRVLQKPRPGVERIVNLRTYQTNGEGVGTGEVTRRVVFTNGSIRQHITTFTRTAGVDKGEFKGLDRKGRRRSGSFEIKRKGDGCPINDEGTMALVLIYPAPVTTTNLPDFLRAEEQGDVAVSSTTTAVVPLTRKRERLDITLGSGKRTTKGTLTMSNDTKRTKETVQTIIRPLACANYQGRYKATVMGTKYNRATIDLIRQVWQGFTRTHGVITNRDGTRKKVDFVAYQGVRLGKKFQ